MTKDSKSPYEIRLECLRMAKEHLESEYYAEQDRLSQISALNSEEVSALALDAADSLSSLSFPSEDAIVGLGNQFYGFVADTETNVETRMKRSYTRTSHTKEKKDEQE